MAHAESQQSKGDNSLGSKEGELNLVGANHGNDPKDSRSYEVELQEKSPRAEKLGDDAMISSRKGRQLRSIKLNLGAICLVWVFTFTSYSGLQNLESSLNARVGTYALAGLTGGGFLTCLLAPAVISKIGCKGDFFSLIPVCVLSVCFTYSQI